MLLLSTHPHMGPQCETQNGTEVLLLMPPFPHAVEFGRDDGAEFHPRPAERDPTAEAPELRVEETFAVFGTG